VNPASPNLADLLKFLSDTLQQGKDFTIEQAPLFVKELLWWNAAQSFLFIGVVTMLTIIWLVPVRKIVASANDFDASQKSTWNWTSVAIGGLFWTIFASVNVWDLVKVWIAPRVVIMEMVQQLISGRH
jgi:hypothetical protein